MSKAMIKQIRILGINYPVEYICLRTHGTHVGQCDNTQCIIRICKTDNSSSHAKSVLLHEIIEALNYRLELELDHNKITSLEAGLTQVFMDNPKLLELYK